MDVGYGPGGDLGRAVLTRCRWFVTPVRNHQFWQLATVYEWRISDEVSWYGERYYIDATGAVVARSSSGDAPPARPASTPEPAPTVGPTPSQTASAWGPWPPVGSEIIEFPSFPTIDLARVAVVDLSGALVEVRAPTAQDGNPAGPDEAFFRDASADGRYRLRWGTTICDREMRVTIDADVARIVIEHAPRDGCDAMGVGRELVLEFARDVDPSDVTLEIIPAERLSDERRFVVQPTDSDGASVVPIAVIDATGTVTSARAASDQETGFFTDTIPDGAVRVLNLTIGGLLVLWDGSLCDDDLEVRLDAIDGTGPPDRITVSGSRGKSCRLALVRRGVHLDLAVDVDASTVTGRNFIGAEVVPPGTSEASYVPKSLFGLEVIDVGTARAIQARPDDDQEIAVVGWLSRQNPATILCIGTPADGADALFLGVPVCRADSLSANRDGPAADSLQVVLGAQTSTSSLPYDVPTQVILVGHFDDRRAEGCQRLRCKDMFWVDALWVDGEPMPRDWVEPVRGGSAALHTPDDAWDRVRGPDEDPLIRLSVGQITASTLMALEPATAGVIPAEMWTWHVTAYEPSSGRLRTFVIPDSSLGHADGVIWYEVGNELFTTTRIID